MRIRLTDEVLGGVRPTRRAVELGDTDEPALVARVSKRERRITFGVRYRALDGRQVRRALGLSYPACSIEQARQAARDEIERATGRTRQIELGLNGDDERKREALAA